MRNRLFALTALTLLLSTSFVFAGSYTITQNFSVAGDPFMRIDDNGVDEELNPNRSQDEDFDLTPTGFSWGGYVSTTGFRVEIDQNDRGGATFDELVFKSHATLGLDVSDSYAYTILSSTGDNVPDQFIDMSQADAKINFKISDIWNGFFGGEATDNGSGLPSPANEERATVLRAMLRDANGDWFMSDLFCPYTLEETDRDGTIIEYSLDVASVSWRKLSQTEIDNLNALAPADEIALNADPAVGDAPDLSAVSGFGVYVWSVWANAAGQVAFSEISLEGEGLAQYEIAQNFSIPGNIFNRIDENGQDELINPRRDLGADFDLTPTGFSWGGYASTTGYRVEIDENSRGGVTFDELVFKATAALPKIHDSYAYTIMASNGSNAPDTFIDMSRPGAAINFQISDIWNGYFDEGDTGAGFEDPNCNKPRATVLRAMLRDTAGDWFMSDLFCPSVYQGGDLDGTILDYSLPVATVSWRKLPQAEIDNLNALVGADEIPLTRDPAVSDAPDLTAVSGFGIYVWNVFDTSNGQLAFTQISLTGEEVVPAVELGQSFDKLTDNYQLIDDSTANTEQPSSSDFTTTDTGWTWGGYCAPEALRVELDRNTYTDANSVVRTHDELAFKNPAVAAGAPIYGSYAYTIFDSSGGNSPDTFIDMSGPIDGLELKISDIWQGWFGNPDNGSGLPGLESEIRATVLRAMIRDAAGNWYASELFCPSTIEGSDGEFAGQIVEYFFSFGGRTWYEYTPAENANLNALAAADEMALTRDPAVAAAAPDLTQVSGMGIYIWSQFNAASGKFAINEISLLGSELITPPEYWDYEELNDMVGDWLKDSSAWTETMDTDPALGDHWELRDAKPGDYLMSGGQMVILGNTDNWRLDTTPLSTFPGTTSSRVLMKATSVSADQTPVNRAGINFWFVGNVDETYGTFSANCGVVLESDGTQYVEFISGWDSGVIWPPASFLKIEGDGVTEFDNSMLDIQITVEPNQPLPIDAEVSYVISDGTTTATGSYTLNARDTITVPSAFTIYSGGAQGVIDYVEINGSYASPYDRAGSDGIIKLDDFEWLNARWMTERTEQWP